MRTCIGCGRKAAAADLVRVVRRPHGELAAGRLLAGRGAWLCDLAGPCVENAVRRRGFERALRASLAPGAVERLRANVPKRGRMQGRDVILNVEASN